MDTLRDRVELNKMWESGKRSLEGMARRVNLNETTLKLTATPVIAILHLNQRW